MKKNKTGGKLLLLILTAAVMLNMQEFQVLAEPLQQEGQPEIRNGQDQPDMEELEELEALELEEPETSGVEEDQEETESELNGEEKSDSGQDSFTLDGHTFYGLNPEQAVVNLFDYWQDEGPDPEKEIMNDWADPDGTWHELCDMGISKGHLLRFGLTKTGEESKWDYGEWNRYKEGEPYQGIVKNTLGDDGFPQLNFVGRPNEDFKNYNVNHSDWLTDIKKGESLAYLFKPEPDTYKNSYSNVQGLFQVDKNGYYCYDSKKNFAQFNQAESSFILYDAPGVGTNPDQASGSVENYGEFFPFNSGEQVFNAVDENGRLIYQDTDPDRVVVGNGASYLACTAPELNHYIGMTLEVPFLQPERGLLPGNTPMCFEFSGDDDVWIFIDDVLVADLGGIHDAYSLTIDFSTGEVTIPSLKSKPATHYLYDSFAEAYPNTEISGFTGKTFSDNTVHTLKMFYLERGYMASNLYLRFNLQIARYDQIKKVDQNGNAISNVSFELYPAKEYESDAEGRFLCNSTVSGKTYYVEQTGNTPLVRFTTGTDGMADFIDQAKNSGYSFSRSPTNFYILHETGHPAGYRTQPVDIVLEYNPDTTMLSVANRWETGAYASFTSYVNERTGTGYEMTYGQYNGNAGLIEPSTQKVEEKSKEKGLILAVPMLRIGGKGGSWQPLYGSNIEGFHTAGDVGSTEESMQKALLKAALNQCRYEEGWYLEWSSEKKMLEGHLSDLPGRADRYQHVNDDGDMQMVYIIIEPEGFEAAGINAGNSSDRYQALKQYVKENGIDAAVDGIYGSSAKSRNVNLLNTSQFMRIFRSLIYIPNEQRELIVQKVDKKGAPVNGAVFGIFDTIEKAEKNDSPIISGKTATVEIEEGETEEGILIFKPQVENKDGYAKMVWADAPNKTYYLKEISAPDGYEINETVIPIMIGTYSIYADAGAKDDGISVMAGVGKLCQTMKKYASDGDVNITLRDITAIAQVQDSGKFVPDGWDDDADIPQKDLHYNRNCRMGMDYGLHDEASEDLPFFTTDTGFLRTRVIQNTEALKEELYSGAENNANWDDLKDTDLTGLFSLLNVVVVEDRNPPGRELRVLKTDESGRPLNGAQFGLYSSREDAQEEKNAAASGTTANVSGQDGVLVFQDQTDDRPGLAKVTWEEGIYYLKEISAPDGYQVNETIITVVVEENAVYADAGAEDDGVAVMAGVGCLDWEKTKAYRDGGKVSLTLRDITAAAMGQASGDYKTDGWEYLVDEDGHKQEKDLHYGINREMGMDYGLHDGAIEASPFFTTETGFLRTHVVQNAEALRGGVYEEGVDAGSWTDLGEADLTDWFIQLNIVVVKDQKTVNPGGGPGTSVTGSEEPGANPDTDPETAPDKRKGMESFLTSFDTLLNRIGIPETGDDSLMWWWALLSSVSLLGIGSTVSNLIFVKRKQRKHVTEKEQKDPLPERKWKILPKERKQKDPPPERKRKILPKERKQKDPPPERKIIILKERKQKDPPPEKIRKILSKEKKQKDPSKKRKRKDFLKGSRQKNHLSKSKQKKHPQGKKRKKHPSKR